MQKYTHMIYICIHREKPTKKEQKERMGGNGDKFGAGKGRSGGKVKREREREKGHMIVGRGGNW